MWQRWNAACEDGRWVELALGYALCYAFLLAVFPVRVQLLVFADCQDTLKLDCFTSGGDYYKVVQI
jgi:hypothetical protein